MGKHGHRISQEAVSYTHLDVYKRQLMIRSSNDIIRDLLRYHVDFARDGLGNLAFTRAVSYTHLDVYKRQIIQEPE